MALELVMPESVKTDADKLLFAYAVQEKLRLEHNATGAAYRAAVGDLAVALDAECARQKKAAPGLTAQNLNLPMADRLIAPASASVEYLAKRQAVVAARDAFETYRAGQYQPRNEAVCKTILALKHNPPQAVMDLVDLAKCFAEKAEQA